MSVWAGTLSSVAEPPSIQLSELENLRWILASHVIHNVTNNKSNNVINDIKDRPFSLVIFDNNKVKVNNMRLGTQVLNVK